MNTIPKRGPRLAHSEDLRKLEAKHAGHLSPGTSTWETSIESLFKRVVEAGPRKGARLLERAAGYLGSVGFEERAFLVLASGGTSRNAHLVLATFSVGNHPDGAVREEGLNILLHIIHCSRSKPSCGVGIPVAFVSRHALNRIYERGDDITENSHVSSALAFITVLGFLAHRCERLADSGLYMRFSGLLAAGALHRFRRILPERTQRRGVRLRRPDVASSG